MPQVRIYADQIARLGGDRQGTLRLAVARFQRGEIVVKAAKATPKTPNLPQKRSIAPLAVSRRFDGIDDATLRAILDAHFSRPRDAADHRAAYRKWDRICKAMLKNLPEVIYERAQ